MKPTTLSITEAQKLGFGRVARDAEDAGVIVLERHGKAIAIVTPMTPAGFVRFMEVMFASLTETFKRIRGTGMRILAAFGVALFLSASLVACSGTSDDAYQDTSATSVDTTSMGSAGGTTGSTVDTAGTGDGTADSIEMSDTTVIGSGAGNGTGHMDTGATTGSGTPSSSGR